MLKKINFMSKYLLVFISVFILACNQSKSKKEATSDEKPEKELPSYVTKVLDAHGGLDRWNTMNSMSYEMVLSKGTEKQTIDLSNRKELIEHPDYQMGYDGENYWTTADTSVKKNPIFYKNLIFYFYAMPFVAADDGIIYEEMPALEFDGISYPGFKISYEAGIGVSPEDEYFIHYNPETYQMEWLGYTVTYFSQEKSKKISWRRYNDWTTISGLKLPQSMWRMTSENNLPIENKSKVEFKDPAVGTEKLEANFSQMPTNGRIVKE